MSQHEVISFERANESRRQRRDRIKAEKALRQVLADDGKTEVEIEGNALPTFQGRRWGKLERDGFFGPPTISLPKHRVTSLRFGAATPFVAEAGLGTDGAFVGLDLEAGGIFAMDPWELVKNKHITGPSMLTIGIPGTGKSTTNKCLATRLIALGRHVAVTSDPKGEWVRIALAIGGRVIKVGPSCATRLNPLDPGQRPEHISDIEWDGLVARRRRNTVVTVLSLLRQGKPLTEYEHTALDMTMTEVLDRNTTPTLVDVMERLLSPSKEVLDVLGGVNHGEALGHALRRMVIGDLQGMFDGPSTEEVGSDTPMIVIDTSDLLGASDEAVAIATACCSAWIDSIVRSGRKEFWLIIQEEGWSAMRDPKVVESMDERQRLAGEYGIANMLIMHELKDLDMVGPAGSSQRNQAEGLMSKSQIKIIHRQAHESVEKLAEVLGLTPREAEIVTMLEKGVALWKIGNKSVLVHTHITPNEFALFNTDARRQG